MTGPVDSDASFQSFYQRFGGLVYATAFMVLGDRNLAEDACQETWIRVDRALSRGLRPEYPESWILTISRREARRLRLRRASSPLPEAVAAPAAPDPLLIEERERRVREALSSLPADDRRLLLLADLSGASIRELCRLSGLKRSSLYRKLEATRDRLRRLLADSGEGDPSGR